MLPPAYSICFSPAMKWAHIMSCSYSNYLQVCSENYSPICTRAKITISPSKRAINLPNSLTGSLYFRILNKKKAFNMGGRILPSQTNCQIKVLALPRSLIFSTINDGMRHRKCNSCRSFPRENSRALEMRSKYAIHKHLYLSTTYIYVNYLGTLATLQEETCFLPNCKTFSRMFVGKLYL